MPYLQILLFCALNVVTCQQGQLSNLKIFSSPDGKIKVEIKSEENGLQLMTYYNDEVLETSLLNYSKVITKIESKEIDKEWETVVGERKTVRDHHTEITVNTIDHEDRDLRIECRIYNGGFAFRTHFIDEKFRNLTIDNEFVHWKFSGDYDTWVTTASQGKYSQVSLSKISQAVERPLLIEGSNDIFFALGEAAVVDYARSKFSKSSFADHAVTISPEGNIDLEKANYMTPWRYVLIGENPGEILENNFIIENLNLENQIDDTSWIKPGKVLREVTLTTQGAVASVDFAAMHGLQYIEFDAGWYGNEYSKESDATTITIDPNRSSGPLDLHKVIAYAKERGIGIILYVNNNAMLKQLDEILPLYRTWGIAGVKYGFVNTGTQKWNMWLHEAVRKAAAHQLMVDIHDDYRPTGFSRTYPNLVTQEGVRGDEESPTVEESLYTIFIRGIAGAADNTNCYQAPRVTEKLGGKAAQMAKSIMIFSPWQFLYWYDRPVKSPRKKGGAGSSESILFPDQGYEFYTELPTVWEEMKVLNVSLGEYGMIARKSNGRWFIGGLNANVKRNLSFDLGFLDEDEKYSGVVYFQDENALAKNTVLRKEVTVMEGMKYEIEVPADAGFAIVLTKK